MFKAMFSSPPQYPPISMQSNDLVHRAADPGKSEMKDIERAFARLFSTDDGRTVLAHLQMMTFHRALGPGSPDEQLRYAEGQRSLVATVLRLIDRGRQA